MKPDRFGKPVRFFVSTRHYKFDSVLVFFQALLFPEKTGHGPQVDPISVPKIILLESLPQDQSLSFSKRQVMNSLLQPPL
jgi:hypothetical protein